MKSRGLVKKRSGESEGRGKKLKQGSEERENGDEVGLNRKLKRNKKEEQ